MKTVANLVGIIAAYTIAFKIGPVVTGVMLTAHLISEFLDYRENQEMVWQLKFYKNLDNIHEQYAEKDTGHC